jgi:hypothetical protein
MRFAFLCLALLSATPALAGVTTSDQPAAVEVKIGTVLRDANDVRLGTVNRVNPDGSVRIILRGKLVVIPAASVSSVGGKLVTKMTEREIISAHGS